MKSKKAEEYLFENGLGYPYTGYVTEPAAERAAELAEQEAEERVRQKAIEAHREVCFFLNFKDNTCANTATPCGEHSCYYMNYIIQKLDEEDVIFERI